MSLLTLTATGRLPLCRVGDACSTRAKRVACHVPQVREDLYCKGEFISNRVISYYWIIGNVCDVLLYSAHCTNWGHTEVVYSDKTLNCVITALSLKIVIALVKKNPLKPHVLTTHYDRNPWISIVALLLIQSCVPAYKLPITSRV